MRGENKLSTVNCQLSIIMKFSFSLFVFRLSFLSVLLTSCVDVDEYQSDVENNMEALWTIMDEHYCFFAEKEAELGVNWDEVHERYRRNVNNKMSRYQLFEFLGNMVGELRDGHVNISAAFDYARNWSWKEDYPKNFSDSLQRKYLGTKYGIAAGVYYCTLDDNIGYMYVGSFEDSFGDGNLDEVLYALAPCNGLIIDVRNNGGGRLTEAQHLASRFCNERTLVGYMSHKTGTGRSDFSAKEEQWLEPSTGLRWQKGVCVLSNRSVYSAANEFVKYMKALGHTIVGDVTGGGSGMPFSAELSNGWGVRFSACPMYDVDGVCTEKGVAPDVAVGIKDEDFQKGKDTIIETARKILQE